MIFAGKPKDGQPKRRSLIVEAFNPHIGDSIRPIGQSFGLLTNLLAMIFVMQGLFPRNHPALAAEPGTAKLRMQDVIATAWGNLAFTREGLPKVLFFFAVIGSMVVSALGVLTVLMSLMVGTAHAQACPPQGCFTPAVPANDLGYNIINFLFGTAAQQGTAYNNLNTQYGTFAGGTLPNNNIQTALQQGLGLYSGAMLIFAAIILFYHLAAMIVDTAHSGVTLGKRANQIWAPIRLVAAVALLVPIAGGLNSGQLIVLKMAQWGGGLASNVWDVFKTQMTAGAQGQWAAPAVPPVTDVVTNVALMAACEYEYNYYQYSVAQNDVTMAQNVPNQFIVGWPNGFAPNTAWQFGNDPIVPGGNIPLSYVANPPPPPPNTSPLIETTAAGTIYHFQSLQPTTGTKDYCGSITIPAPPSFQAGSAQQTLAQNIYNAQVNTFNQYLPQIMHYGSNIQQYIQDSGQQTAQGGQGDINPDLSGTTISTIIANYQSTLNAAVAAATASNVAFTDQYVGLGWMGAGAFFNQIANIQGAAQSSSDHYMPTMEAPNADMSNFQMNIQTSVTDQNPATLPPVAMPGGGGCPASQANNWVDGLVGIVKSSTFSVFDFFLDVVNLGASQTGVWCGDGTIGIRFTGSNPLSQMAAWGHQNMDLAVDIVNISAWFMVVGDEFEGSGPIMGRLAAAAQTGISYVTSLFGSSSGSKQGQAIANNINKGPTLASAAAVIFQGGTRDIGEFLLPAAALFLTLGFTFGYMLPILPFMHFLFGCITWLTVLFEAVIAMPLVALAHINPEGEGLPGQYAREAYFMAFSILLRPVLMIFGLICGFITLMLAVSLLNIFFAHAMTGSTAQDHHTLVKIIYTIIYSVILVSIASHAFHLITFIPDKVMSWIGAHGAKGEPMGNVGAIEEKAAFGAGYLSKEGIPQIGNALPQAAKGIGSGINKLLR